MLKDKMLAGHRPASQSTWNPKHADIFEWERVKHFFVAAAGFIAFQFSFGLPLIICGIMIGTLGDALSLAIFGLGRTFTSVFYNAILTAVTETFGVNSSKLYSQAEYTQVGSMLWKTILCVLILNGICATLSYNSFDIMMMLNIDEELAYFTSRFLISSLPYLAIQGFNNTFVSFLAAQSLNKLFIYINIISIFIMSGAGYYFIIVCQYKHMGFIYAKILQESVIFICYLSIIYFQANRKTLMFPWPSAVFKGFDSYFVVMGKTILCFYGEYLGLEMTVYFAALLHSVNDLALFCSYVSFSIFPWLISNGLGNTQRTLIGQLIGEGKHKEARRRSQQYFVYIFFVAIVLTMLILTFRYEIGYIYTGDPILTFKLGDIMRIYCPILYAALAYNSALSIYRLLGLDNILLLVSTVAYPILVTVGSWFFCFGLNMRVGGLVLGIVVARTCVCFYVVRKLFNDIDWKNPTGVSVDSNPPK
jgi:Na+-driven multidrug efflux pump